MRRGEIRDPIMTLVLTWVTCGIYYWYWMYKASEEINAGLGREEYDPGMELLLAIVTFGLWVIWWDWRVSESIYEMEQRWGLEPKMEPALMFLTNFFGLGPLFYQRSMNHAWEQGRPGAGPPRRLGHQQQPQGGFDPRDGYAGQPQQHHPHGGAQPGQRPPQQHQPGGAQPGQRPRQPQQPPQGQHGPQSPPQPGAPQAGAPQRPSSPQDKPAGADSKPPASAGEGEWKGSGDWE